MILAAVCSASPPPFFPRLPTSRLCRGALRPSAQVFETYALLKKANRSGEIQIKTLPKEIQPTLKVFDVDGDGTVAPMELARGAELYLESKKMVKKLTRLALALLLLMGIMLAAITGLVFTVVELSKETRMEGGVMLDKTTGMPTASAGLSDASGVSKTADNKTASAAVNSVPASLNSALPDEAFDEMRYLRIENEHAKLVLTITGWARFYEGDGSTVLLMTHMGEVAITGTDLSFDAVVSPVFEQAGFVVDPTGRRLASLYQLVGLFNNVDSMAGLSSDAEPPTFPSKFYVEYEMFYGCYQLAEKSKAYNRCTNHLSEGAQQHMVSNMGVSLTPNGKSPTAAQNYYVKSATGRMWFDGNRAMEVKNSVLTPGLSSATVNLPGETMDGDRKLTWQFDAAEAGEAGYDYAAPTSTDIADHMGSPLYRCESKEGEEAKGMGMTELLAEHFTGHFDGVKDALPGLYAFGGRRLRKFRLQGDATVKNMTAYMYDECVGGALRDDGLCEGGDLVPRRVSNMLEGEHTVFVLKCMNEECGEQYAAEDWAFDSAWEELPSGCTPPLGDQQKAMVLKPGPGVTPYADGNPFPAGANANMESEQARKLMAYMAESADLINEGAAAPHERHLKMDMRPGVHPHLLTNSIAEQWAATGISPEDFAGRGASGGRGLFSSKLEEVWELSGGFDREVVGARHERKRLRASARRARQLMSAGADRESAERQAGEERDAEAAADEQFGRQLLSTCIAQNSAAKEKVAKAMSGKNVDTTRAKNLMLGLSYLGGAQPGSKRAMTRGDQSEHCGVDLQVALPLPVSPGGWTALRQCATGADYNSGCDCLSVLLLGWNTQGDNKAMDEEFCIDGTCFPTGSLVLDPSQWHAYAPCMIGFQSSYYPVGGIFLASGLLMIDVSPYGPGANGAHHGGFGSQGLYISGMVTLTLAGLGVEVAAVEAGGGYVTWPNGIDKIPCVMAGTCKNRALMSSGDRVGYGALEGSLNLGSIWGDVALYFFPEGELDDKWGWRLEYEVNVGINLGFINVAAWTLKNHDAPYVWFSSSDENADSKSGEQNAKAGLGETCDGDSDCAIGYCCACYYDLDDSYGSRYFCDDKASWADSCYGTEAVKILLAKGYSRSSYSDYC